MASPDPITAAELRAALHYDPLTGIFTWRERHDCNAWWNTQFAGKRAGCIANRANGRSYRVIGLFGKLYQAHQLAWLYMTDTFPPAGLSPDHIDTDGLNNRWANLRLATPSQNIANARRSAANTTGYKGVSLERRSGRYRANIVINRKQKYLGLFDTPEEAHEAYKRAAKKTFGVFARTG